MTTVPTLFHGGTTATSDLPFKLSLNECWVEWVDIFVLANGALFGDLGGQDLPVFANDIYYTSLPIDLSDIYIKNLTAGANVQVGFYAMIMTDARKKILGIPIVR